MQKIYKFTSWYSKSLERRPILTKCSTAAAISCLGDVICQTIDKKKDEKYDIKRNVQFSSIGFFFVAPMLHLNYSKILPFLFPSGVKYEALKKLAFDQSIFASIMTAGFFCLINCIEGNGIQKGINDTKEKYLTTMMVNWKLWIPASFVNFTIMPNQYQVLFANCVSVIYNIMLSSIHNKDKGKSKSE